MMCGKRIREDADSGKPAYMAGFPWLRYIRELFGTGVLMFSRVRIVAFPRHITDIDPVSDPVSSRIVIQSLI